MNRLTETEKWNDKWFRGLSPKHKCLWLYLLDRANHVGIWEPDWEDATFRIGDDISESDLEPDFKERVVKRDDGNLFIPKLLPFQNKKLSYDSPAHQHIFVLLKKYGLKIPVPTVGKPHTELTNNGAEPPEPAFESSEPPRTPLKSETLDAFNQFWKAYPKKRNIIESQRAFVEVQGAAHIKEILAALSWQTESDEWSDNDGKYIPSPVNYLRDRRWEDEGDGTGPKVPDEENPLITVRGGKMFNACGLHWSRTDGGPRREQFGKGDDQESAYQACRTGYDSWIQTPEKKNGQ